MNETVKTILKRRSCRQFNKEIISDEDLLTIIRCGIHAPTALNKQNLFFIHHERWLTITVFAGSGDENRIQGAVIETVDSDIQIITVDN